METLIGDRRLLALRRNGVPAQSIRALLKQAGPTAQAAQLPRRLCLIVGLGGILWCLPQLSANELAWNAPGQAQSPSTAAAAGPSQTVSASSPSVDHPADHDQLLNEAKEFYRKGDFDHAIQNYQRVIQESPNSPEAYVGLTRVYLKEKDVLHADATINKAVHVADSPAVRVALGELYFRQGKILEAEQQWAGVINSGHQDARAYLGLARARQALSMYKSARTMLEKAYQLDPSDSEIRTRWAQTLSRAERIKFLEEYLAGETNDDAETRAGMQHYLEYLKARAKDPRGGCHLVSKATETETRLVRLLVDPIHLRGYGLTVVVNGKKSDLLLDTGASGILINRSLAEKAGVTRLSDTDIGGVGEKGNKNGYRGLVDSLKIGGLEFQNCPVAVLEQRSVTGEEGLIGADVFSAFLVDIDFPNEKLRLGKLPQRPHENTTTVTLQTERGDSDSTGEEVGKNPEGATSAKSAPPPRSGPQDRYIAPEMNSYTQVYRFGHSLLITTSIGDAPLKLFLIDTGSTHNLISNSAAEEVTKVHSDPRATLNGISGSVKEVYRADKAVIQFGHLRQETQDLMAFDLKRLSDRTGTEISGILGFTTLRMLDVKIDYRDGLVDFNYDPNRWGH